MMNTRRFRRVAERLDPDGRALVLDFCKVIGAKVPAGQRTSAWLSAVAARRVDRLLDRAVIVVAKEPC